MGRKILLLLLWPFALEAQDVSGLWKGYLESAGNRFPYEVALSPAEGSFKGYALTIFTFNGTENMGIKSIRIKNKNGKMSMEDNELVFDNYSTPPKKVKLLATLTFLSSSSQETLEGSFFTRSLDLREQDKTPFTGTVYLKKQDPQTDSKLLDQLEALHLLQTLAFFPARKSPGEAPVVVEAPLPFPPGERNIAPESVFPASHPIVMPPVSPGFHSVVREAPAIAYQPLQVSRQKSLAVEDKAGTQGGIRPRPAPPAPPEQRFLVRRVVPVAAAGTAVSTTLSAPPPAAEWIQRKTEVIRQVPFSSDSLVLSLYDNGTIDGDTVSVVLNGRVLMARVGLTANAVRTTIHITPEMGDSLQLVMYAENLGSIPPNTGLLVVQEGETRTSIRFEGDMQKSSAIIFTRKR